MGGYQAVTEGSPELRARNARQAGFEGAASKYALEAAGNQIVKDSGDVAYGAGTLIGSETLREAGQSMNDYADQTFPVPKAYETTRAVQGGRAMGVAGGLAAGGLAGAGFKAGAKTIANTVGKNPERVMGILEKSGEALVAARDSLKSAGSTARELEQKGASAEDVRTGAWGAAGSSLTTRGGTKLLGKATDDALRDMGIDPKTAAPELRDQVSGMLEAYAGKHFQNRIVSSTPSETTEPWDR
ncbi:hypothetical protein [Magnetospira sp. QH-2]|uniref:hypothetical protein n=1 Tax=Magnetospira sp. (strain QH-2) TaxID=1288970 RepID=UPI0003E81289|nr:hypothetical protein [Magnetospira sp. QH-2]CCQ74807.1 protein of unknown function [Magnetospira sp. QH-2]